jgi:ADP-ribosyl-[dinitrogen reductase] hydrolase
VHNQSKIHGMLLGLHVGDSLGATLEFKRASKKSDFQRDIIGGGAFDWSPGAATDDTDLMICILQSIANKKSLDIEDLAEKFLEWFAKDPADIGNTTQVAFMRLKKGVHPSKSGLNEEHNQGNGSLMRCAPLVLLYVNDEQLMRDAKAQASITHSYENCIIIDYLFVRALRDVLTGSTKEEIFLKTTDRIKKLLPEIFDSFMNIPNIPWDSLKTSGYMIDTFIAAFWGLHHFTTFEESLIHIVNRGDDSDTVGAVTGALCGAFYGSEAIPNRWLNIIQRRDDISELLANFTT